MKSTKQPHKKNGLKKAFTLAEILFCLILIGFLYMIIINNTKTDKFEQKANIANAYKAVSAIEEASIKLRNNENENCPNGFFIQDVAGTDELLLYKDDGSAPLANDVIDIFAKYLKYTKKDFDFCNYTTYCETAEIDSPEDIKGMKLPGGIIVGIEMLDKISKCPDYYSISTKEKVEGTDVCWAKLYIDTNAKKEPNKLNEDVFIFGLDKYGVHK